MPLTPRLSTRAANEAADAVCAQLHGGSLVLYSGAQPETADTPPDPTKQKRLARLTFGLPAFRLATKGMAEATPIASAAMAEETGTATWFRASSADGTPMFDGSVGTSGANLNLNSVAISIGAAVSVTAFSYTQKA